MNEKLFKLLFFLILVFALLLRILPARDNNFYFTMDQGNDAVHVREILYHHRILLLGPETGIDGLFAGPLWYYFIALGYVLFAGHPFGAVFMLILLNVGLLGILMLKIAKEVSKGWALLVGASLLTSWGFYDTSRYGFNPFPLVALSFLLIFCLIDFLKGKNKSFILAAIPIGLGFNTEVAGSIALALFYFLIGIWALVKRKMPGKNIALGICVLALFFLPHITTELTSGFPQTHTLLKEMRNPQGVFSDQSFNILTPGVAKLISRSTLQQVPEIGVLIFTIVVLLVFRKWKSQPKRTNAFIKYFVALTLVLTLVTWLWFSSNKGWQSWHTVYLPPLIFVSTLLLLFELRKSIAISILAISLVSHIFIFKERYLEYFQPSRDPSILKNELGAIDWVYQKSEGEGFYEYTYLPSVLDYPYQYLLWWQGRKQYGYVPCEYSSYPGAPKLFVPGSGYYGNPKRECSKLRFLIIEPDKNEFVRNQWLEGVRQGTSLLQKTSVGSIRIEMRRID